MLSCEWKSWIKMLSYEWNPPDLLPSIHKKVITRVITGRTPSQFQIQTHWWKWRRSRGGDELWGTDMLCWELTILPSHQCCATFRFKEHVWLVVNTSFNQGWPYLGSNWPRRSAAPVGCCPDWIPQIIANAGCGSPLAPWWQMLLVAILELF